MADKNDSRAPERPPIPEYELDSYEPVEFTMPRLKITDEQVEKKMQDMAEQFGADYQPTDRKVVGPKEHLSFDIEVSKDGVPIENLTSEDRLYSLGEALMPIDFDRNVLGMKVGETKEFDFKAPDFDKLETREEATYHAKVTIKTIMKKCIPQITDEWVNKYMPLYKNAAEYRKNVREGLQKEAERMIEQEKNSYAVHALAERFHGKIDDYFYEATRADLRATYEQQARAQGMDLEDWIGKQGMDQNTFSMMLMFQVRDTLVQGFALDSWARHYGIEPTEEDLKTVATMMAPQGRGEEIYLKMTANEEDKEALTVAARRYVANVDLTGRAKITYED